MNKLRNKVLLKLGLIGVLGILLFNPPFLEIYSGYFGVYPILFVVMFLLWVVIVILGAFVIEKKSTQQNSLPAKEQK